MHPTDIIYLCHYLDLDSTFETVVVTVFSSMGLCPFLEPMQRFGIGNARVRLNLHPGQDLLDCDLDSRRIC